MGQCIVREVQEETGLQVPLRHWFELGEIETSEEIVGVYTVAFQGDRNAVFSADKEIVEWFSVEELPSNILENLLWLIPMAQMKLSGWGPDRMKVVYE